MENNNQLTDREKIAERLKSSRSLAGLSQENAAKLMMLQRPAISEIESGRRKVSAEEIIQFADLYKVSSSWLLGKEEENEIEMNDEFKIAARDWSKMNRLEKQKLMELIKVFSQK